MVTVQIVICVLFLLFVAFWVGRRIGRMRVFNLEKILEESRAGAEHIVRTMDEVVEKHEESMGTRTEDLKELLLVADKKVACVYELLDELEELRDEVKKRALSPEVKGADMAMQSRERRLKREIEKGLDGFKDKVLALQEQVLTLEEENHKLKTEINDRPKSKGISEDEVRTIVAKEIGVYLSFLDPDSSLDSVEINAQVEADIEKQMALETYATERRVLADESFGYSLETEEQYSPPLTHKPALTFSQKEKGLERSSYVPESPLSREITAEEQQVFERLSPSGQEIPRQAVQVLEMYEQGIVLPQIAQTLRMGVGEAELLLRLYSREKD